MSDPFEFILQTPQNSTAQASTGARNNNQNAGKDLLSDLDVFGTLGINNSKNAILGSETAPAKK